MDSFFKSLFGKDDDKDKEENVEDSKESTTTESTTTESNPQKNTKSFSKSLVNVSQIDPNTTEPAYILENGTEEAIRAVFLAQKVNINSPNDKGNTFAHLSVLHGLESVTAIINLGGRCDIYNDLGYLPEDLTEDMQIKHILRRAFIIFHLLTFHCLV